MNEFAFNLQASFASLFSAGAILLVQLTAATSGILFLAGVTVLTLRNQAASIRHRVWMLGMFGCLLLPFFMAALPNLGPQWNTELVAQPPVSNPWGKLAAQHAFRPPKTDSSNPVTQWALVDESEAQPNHVASAASPVATPTHDDLMVAGPEITTTEIGRTIAAETSAPQTGFAHGFGRTVVAVWLAGIAASLTVLARNQIYARRLVRLSIGVTSGAMTSLMKQLRISAGIHRDVPLLCSTRISVPLTVGAIRPIILLPAGFGQWSRDRCRVVLTHELTHIRRQDVMSQLIARLVCCVYWFHPLVWLVNWRMRIEREFACDDEVLGMGELPDQYAGHLVGVAAAMLQSRKAQPQISKDTPSCAVAMASRSSLEQRVRAILHPYLKRAPVTRGTGRFLLGGMFAVAVTLSLLSPSASQEDSPVTPASSPAQKSAKTARESLPISGTEAKGTNRVAEDTTVHDANHNTSTKSTTIRGLVVNEQGEPVPGARVSVKNYATTTEGRSDADGKFSIELSVENPAGALVRASNADGLLGATQIPYDAETVGAQRVELKSARIVDVTVVQRDGQAAADAAVFIRSDFVTVATGKTNADGQLSLAVPQDRQLQCVLVDAGKRGVDYVVFRRPGSPKNNPFALPHDFGEPITLTLTATRSVTVKAIDQNDNPIADANVHPWHFSLPNKGGDANLGSFMQKQTDANGIVTYDNIPIANEHDLTIWVRKDGYEPEDRFTFDPKSDEQQLTARLLSLVPVRGRVVHQNGSPAAGINVMASGDGHGFDSSFRSQATTTNDGTFELDLAPNKYYAFVARENRWASPLETRVVLDRPVSGIELILQKPTRVFGRVTVGETDAPVSGAYVQLYQKPAGHGYYDLPTDQRLPNPKDHRYAVSPRIVVGGKTDDDGRFEYFVGPGTFYAFGPGGSKQDTFEIVDQHEIEIHLHAKPRLDGKLSGRVVRKDDPTQGVAGANVFREYYAPMAITDEDGNFEAERFDADTLCGAFTDDHKLGTLKNVAAGVKRVQFKLAPTAVLRGTLFDEGTDKPAADEEIGASIRVTHEGGTSSNRFRRSDTTASDGTALELSDDDIGNLLGGLSESRQ